MASEEEAKALSEGKINREQLRRKTTRRVLLDDALRAHSRMMVLGDPGAGKSTLLRYIALREARAATEDGRPKTDATRVGHPSSVVGQAPRLPILIPLRGFAASGQDSLVDYFYAHAEKSLQIKLARGFFERALDEGRGVVCLDGLDEVFVSDQRVAVRDAVAAFAARYAGNQFIVTSRVVGYEAAPLDRGAFAHHTVLPFDEKEIETFIQKWYAAREREPNRAKEQAENLFKTIRANDRLKKLAENPLMLTIIALVHRIEAELPNERVKLYDKCTEALLSTWESVKGLTPQDRERPYYKNRRRLLEKLAFWMHTLPQEEERQAETKRGDLRAQLIAFLLDDATLNLSRDTAELEADAFIAMAQSRTGALVERGDGVYSFVHLTFQEYFAACDLQKRYVTNLDELWKQIQPHLYDARWREVILLLLGRLNEYDEPPSIIVEKILCERDKFDDVLHRNLFLAARCLADRVNAREKLRNEIVDSLFGFASAREPRLSDLRYDAIETLGTLTGDKRSGEGLLALAQDEKVYGYVRRAAAQALGQLGRVDDAAKILLALAQDENVYAWVRREAAEALGQLGRTDNAAKILLALAQDEKVHVNVRRDAAQALGQLGKKEPGVALALLKLAGDKESPVRGAAYSALKEVVGNLRWGEASRQSAVGSRQ